MKEKLLSIVKDTIEKLVDNVSEISCSENWYNTNWYNNNNKTTKQVFFSEINRKNNHYWDQKRSMKYFNAGGFLNHKVSYSDLFEDNESKEFVELRVSILNEPPIDICVKCDRSDIITEHIKPYGLFGQNLTIAKQVSTFKYTWMITYSTYEYELSDFEYLCLFDSYKQSKEINRIKILNDNLDKTIEFLKTK